MANESSAVKLAIFKMNISVTSAVRLIPQYSVQQIQTVLLCSFNDPVHSPRSDTFFPLNHTLDTAVRLFVLSAAKQGCFASQYVQSYSSSTVEECNWCTQNTRNEFGSRSSTRQRPCMCVKLFNHVPSKFMKHKDKLYHRKLKFLNVRRSGKYTNCC